MKDRILLIVAAVFTAAALSFMSTFAAAGTTEYPAGVCAAAGGGTFSRYYGTTANASTTSELNLFCPFVRTSVGISSATFKVLDRHTSLDIYCTLAHEIVNGDNFIFVETTKKSYNFGAAAQWLTFGVMNLGLNSGYYYATCSIPRVDNNQYSHLGSISITEP